MDKAVSRLFANGGNVVNDQISKKDIPPVKPLKSLPLSDNFMFGAVMSDPEVCTLFLEEVLQKKIIRLAYVNSEQTIANIPGLHGIRLDVFVEDEAHNRYDIEMQARGSVYAKHLESRVRFYQSSIDRDFLTSMALAMYLYLSPVQGALYSITVGSRIALPTP